VIDARDPALTVSSDARVVVFPRVSDDAETRTVLVLDWTDGLAGGGERR
jgi:hypothetical protein